MSVLYVRLAGGTRLLFPLAAGVLVMGNGKYAPGTGRLAVANINNQLMATTKGDIRPMWGNQLLFTLNIRPC